MNSLRMSFWNGAAELRLLDALLLAGDDESASTGNTAPFIVIDTDILSSGMPSKRIFMSSTESMATPALPTSPTTLGWSLS